MMRNSIYNLYLNYDSSFAKKDNFAYLVCLCLVDKMDLNGDLTM